MTVEKIEKVFLENLKDDWIDQIIFMSDDEIVNEFESESMNPEEVVRHTRGLYGRAMLMAAKNTIKSRNAEPSENQQVDTISGARVKLEQVLAQNAQSGLTLAARKGKGLTDNDAQTLLSDLKELGIDSSGETQS